MIQRWGRPPNPRSRLIRAPAGVALLVAVTSCKGPPREDPRLDLPTTEAAAEALVQAQTRRAPAPRADADADAARILAAIDAAPGSLVAGEAAITRWIQAALDRGPADSYALFGTWHDAPGQIDAFRRLTGPGGLAGLSVVATELFRADGTWGGASATEQRGDTDALDAYQRTGDREAFARLSREHRDADYVAWKLGFEPVALDLATTARATGVRLLGCDMPSTLQTRTGLPHGELLHRLREIHCVRALARAPTSERLRAALLWGDAHLGPSGLARFLPARASVVFVHLVGQRLEPGTLESALGKELSLAEPMLVPLAADEAALLLPDASLSARVDRALARRSTDVGAPTLFVRAATAATFLVDGRRVAVNKSGIGIDLGAGDHSYVLTGMGRRTAGAVHLQPGHRVELDFDADGSVIYLETTD